MMAGAKPSRPAPIPGAPDPIAARLEPSGRARPAPGHGRPLHHRPILASALGLALILVLAGAAAADDSDLCLLAAQDATRLSGVPLSVLLAITLTETGRGGGGAPPRPWPWTVNVAGEGHWFATRAEATAFADAQVAVGQTSFDVGCFQLNWRWHGENFVSVEQMFDPLANASYAAGFLKTQEAETGDWSLAAGRYHSRTPEYATRYRVIFDGHRATVVAAGADEGSAGGRLVGAFALSGTQVALAQEPAAPRENTYPLLRTSAAPMRLGSLVPLGG